MAQKKPMGGHSLLALSVLSLVAFIAIWEIACRSGLVEPIFLPAPSKVLSRAISLWEQNLLIAHILSSARRVMIGFLVAVLVAIPLGIMLGTNRIARAIFDPILSFLRPLPSMSWIPLSLLWFGITETQKYSIVFMGSFAPALLYVMEATQNIDPILIRAARNLGANRYQVMREVIFPGCMPQILSGMKVILGLSWTCVISAELVASQEGLGFMIMNGREFFQTDTVVLGMVLISFTVLVTDIVFRIIERGVLAWQR